MLKFQDLVNEELKSTNLQTKSKLSQKSFIKLVESSFFLEQQGTPSTFLSSYDSVVKSDLTVIKQYYSDFEFPPNISDFFKKLRDSIIRAGANAQFKTLILDYPNLAFIDFYAYLARYLLSNPNLKGHDSGKSFGKYIASNTNEDYLLPENEVKDAIALFQKDFGKRVQGGHPILDYIPLESTILSLKSKLAADSYESVIGKLALSNYKNSSIKQTVYSLLEARKEARQSLLKGSTPSAISFIEEVLLTPEKFAGATNVVPTAFKKMYKDASIEQLIKIADKAKKLFTAEASDLAEKQNIVDIFPSKIKTSFNNFISNEPLEIEKTSQKTYFNFTVTEKNNNAKVFNPQLVGGYTIDNITNRLKSEQAKELIRELSQFANYIRHQEPTNTLGVLKGISGVTGALAKLGGPEMKM